MKAWVKRNGSLHLEDVPDPTAASDELLIRVGAISLNRGEVRGVARAAEGAIPGWDVAGEVASPGPQHGKRVAAFVSSGGWAELVAVPRSLAAEVPAGVELEVAATLPIAALTVVRALDVAGSLVGKSILVTGGSGGVGRFAIQLGHLAGAHVTAVSSRAVDLGADETVRSIDEAKGPFDLVLESVGGRSLATAIDRVARGGVVVTIGNSSEEETTFNARTLFGKGGARVYGLLIFEEVKSGRVGARDLERLLELVRTGRLHAPVEVRRPFSELPEVLGALEKRTFGGKAVLTV